MSRTQLSRTPLSKQAGVLRTSLLLSLGLSPLACGGSVVTASNGGAGGSAQAGGGDVAGAPSSAGSYQEGGAPSYAGAPYPAGGAAYGGLPIAGGAPSYGGAPYHAGAPSYAGEGPVPACPNPVFNSITKLTECSNGRKHRVEALACVFTLPPIEAGGAAGAAAGGAGNSGAAGAFNRCTSNTDCAALRYGYCDFSAGNGTPTCRSGCTTDSECGVAELCACNGTDPGRCVTADCTTDADCGPNSLCAPTASVCGPGSFQCTTPQDQCITSADCARGTCTSFGDHRGCSNAVCGRPFLIADLPRLAAIEPRADWLDATRAPNLNGLSPVQRAQLAAHWARLGQLEHASIAAFARFQLQLLSLGAPSDLVEACNRALSDETAHARTCFALASAYGDTAVGPARLDIEHCFEDTSLSAIAKLVLREGCLGETVASLEALAAAEVASDPAVKQALTKIARDELNHAELAFKFLRWALSVSPAELHHELAREAAQQLADFESNVRNGERSRTDDRLAAHGLLAGDALRAIHLAAAADVTRPLLAALFEVETSNDA